MKHTFSYPPIQRTNRSNSLIRSQRRGWTSRPRVPSMCTYQGQNIVGLPVRDHRQWAPTASRPARHARIDQRCARSRSSPLLHTYGWPGMIARDDREPRHRLDGTAKPSRIISTQVWITPPGITHCSVPPVCGTMTLTLGGGPSASTNGKYP